MLASYYRRTDGDPLAAVRDTLAKMHRQVRRPATKIGKIFAGTTGSGRYLTGDYIGADLISNEITAQASGALPYAGRVDTIFEIGGQDSKYIRLDGDVIIDFEMNKACAAGTGAFLEKQAARLGITAGGVRRPRAAEHAPAGPGLDLHGLLRVGDGLLPAEQRAGGGPGRGHLPGERQELPATRTSAAARSARRSPSRARWRSTREWSRRMRPSWAARSSSRPIRTSPARSARPAWPISRTPPRARFRGLRRDRRGSHYEITSFECKAAPNRCDVNTFQMDGGPKYFYNDRCEKFSAVHKKNLGEHLPDLFAEREQMMMDAYDRSRPRRARQKVGIPRGLMFAEYFPLYNAFLTGTGLRGRAIDAHQQGASSRWAWTRRSASRASRSRSRTGTTWT